MYAVLLCYASTLICCVLVAIVTVLIVSLLLCSPNRSLQYLINSGRNYLKVQDSSVRVESNDRKSKVSIDVTRRLLSL